jgi:hypothetical protein
MREGRGEKLREEEGDVDWSTPALQDIIIY